VAFNAVSWELIVPLFVFIVLLALYPFMTEAFPSQKPQLCLVWNFAADVFSRSAIITSTVSTTWAACIGHGHSHGRQKSSALPMSGKDLSCRNSILLI
jgi:hypothetical protein